MANVTDVDPVLGPDPRPTCGGGSRIRTLEGRAGGFTVRSHWPLGQPARVVLMVRRAQITLILGNRANHKLLNHQPHRVFKALHESS